MINYDVIKAYITELFENGDDQERIVKMVEDKFYLPRDAIRILINQVKANDENINQINGSASRS